MSALINPIKKTGKHAKDRNPRPHKSSGPKQDRHRSLNDAKIAKAAEPFLNGTSADEKLALLRKILASGDKRRTFQIFEIVLNSPRNKCTGKNILQEMGEWMAEHGKSAAA